MIYFSKFGGFCLFQHNNVPLWFMTEIASGDSLNGPDNPFSQSIYVHYII